MFIKKIPETEEIFFGEVGVDNEVARDAKAQRAREAHRLDRFVDLGLFLKGTQARTGVGLEAEKNVEVLCQRTPLLQQIGIFTDQVGTGLDEHPVLALAGAEQGIAQLFTAFAVCPAQIIDHEEVAASGFKVSHNVVDGVYPVGSPIEL